jgi:signal transduction histidine kinase
VPDPTTRLLEAVRAVGSDLELPVVLRHLVEAAVVLVQAEYGALGVVDASGEGLSEFITVGMDDETVARIGSAPSGLGVLGELLQTPEPLRLRDLAQHVRSVGFPAGHPPMHTFLGVPVRVGDVVFGNLYLTDKRGGREFSEDDEQVLIAFAAAAGVAVRNARLYEQSRRVSAWREAGRTISTALLSGTDREDVIVLLTETSQQVLRADSVFMGLAEGEQLHLAASAGASAPGADAALLADLRPVLLSGRPRAAQSSGLSGFAVPLGPAGGPCQGVLAALWSTPPHPLLIDDLQAFAAQAAVALELAERRDRAEQGALIADRDRIGRDLHDLVIQRLFATGMRLQSVVRLVPSDPVEAVRRIDVAVDDLDATIRELRSTIHGLQAPSDGRPSLRARVLEAVDVGTVQLGFAPALRLDGLLDTLVPDETAEHVVATVREALSNAARHACATSATVSVGLREGTVRVVVEDDGVGVAPTAGSGGLRNLASRALELGGELVLDDSPLGGARLTWLVPVQV